MYGGHIVNDFDRLMSQRMLQFLMRDELLDEFEIFPYPDSGGANFKAPSTSSSYSKVLEHIEVNMMSDR